MPRWSRPVTSSRSRAGPATVATRSATLRASWSARGHRPVLRRSPARAGTAGSRTTTTTVEVVASDQPGDPAAHLSGPRRRGRPAGRRRRGRCAGSAGSRGGLAELAAQPGQVDVDGAVGAAVRLLPDLGQQLALGDDLPRPGGQRQQQVELLAGQLQRPSGERRGARAAASTTSSPTRIGAAGRPAPDRRGAARRGCGRRGARRRTA